MRPISAGTVPRDVSVPVTASMEYIETVPGSKKPGDAVVAYKKLPDGSTATEETECPTLTAPMEVNTPVVGSIVYIAISDELVAT